MKKIIIYIFIFYTSSLSAFAWIGKSDTICFLSPWAGINMYKYSLLNGTSSIELKQWNINYDFGLKFTYNINDEIALRSQLALLNKSFTTNYSFKDVLSQPIGIYTCYNDFYYLNIPFELIYNIQNKRFNIFISAGIHGNYLLKQNTYADLPENVNGVAVDKVSYNNKAAFKNFHFGINIGIGIEVKIKSNFSIFTEYKYDNSFGNIYKIKTNEIKKFTSGHIGLGVKIGIPIKYKVT